MAATYQETAHLVPPYPAEDLIERMIFKSMNEGVITLECNGAIHTVNPAAARILGLTDQNLRGRQFREVLGTDQENEEFMTIFREALGANSRSERQETRFKRRDGQMVDLSVTSAFVKVDTCEASMQSVVVVFRDITALKSLERVKRRAVNHISHELKTPLAIAAASIRGLIEKDLPREQCLKRLKRAQRNLERLSAIQSVVEEVLNPPPFTPALIDLPSAIEDILAGIRSASSHRSVTLTSSIEVAQTDRIDGGWLKTILDTLLKNAIENTPDGGEVAVSLKETESGILLKVKDCGMGLLVQDQEFIFEGFLYTQATEAYASKKPFDFNAGGKGLELLRLKVLSESGHFDIWFESRRCEHIPTDRDTCPGSISACRRVRSSQDCLNSGGTTFSVLFK